MARQTRQQRRARREQQAASAAVEPGRAPQRQLRRAEAQPEPTEPRAAQRRGGVAGFVGESWGELQKVEWPGQKQVIQGTVVVLIACAIVGAYLWGADLVLQRFVENVLLGQ